MTKTIMLRYFFVFFVLFSKVIFRNSGLALLDQPMLLSVLTAITLSFRYKLYQVLALALVKEVSLRPYPPSFVTFDSLVMVYVPVLIVIWYFRQRLQSKTYLVNVLTELERLGSSLALVKVLMYYDGKQALARTLALVTAKSYVTGNIKLTKLAELAIWLAAEWVNNQTSILAAFALSYLLFN